MHGGLETLLSSALILIYTSFLDISGKTKKMTNKCNCSPYPFFSMAVWMLTPLDVQCYKENEDNSRGDIEDFIDWILPLVDQVVVLSASWKSKQVQCTSTAKKIKSFVTVYLSVNMRSVIGQFCGPYFTVQPAARFESFPFPMHPIKYN